MWIGRFSLAFGKESDLAVLREKTMTRDLSRTLDLVLTSTGALAVLTTVFFTNEMSQQVQLIVVVVGLMCAGAGFYGTAVRLTSNERKFGALREEGDKMISLIRQLNRAALSMKKSDGASTHFNNTLKEMHDSVRQMSKIAALADQRLLAESPSDHPEASANIVN